MCKVSGLHGKRGRFWRCQDGQVQTSRKRTFESEKEVGFLLLVGKGACAASGWEGLSVR